MADEVQVKRKTGLLVMDITISFFFLGKETRTKEEAWSKFSQIIHLIV